MQDMQKLRQLKENYYGSRKADLRAYLRKRSAHTYDVADLKADYGDVIPLFVYDQLMVGCSDDFRMKEALLFGPATTMSDEYVLMNNTKNIVAAFPETKTCKEGNALLPAHFKRLQGELYGVPLDFIFMLDNAYENGFKYDRVEIPIKLHNNGMGTLVRNVQFYCGNYSYWKVHVEKNPNSQFRLCPTIASRYLGHERVYRYQAYEELTWPPRKEEKNIAPDDFEAWRAQEGY